MLADDQQGGDASSGTAPSATPRTLAEALRMAAAVADFLNSPAVADVDGAACGEALTALYGVRDKMAAAQITFLHRFDAADAHDADGYGSSSAWLAAKCSMSRRTARASVWQMRQLTGRPLLHAALADGDLSESWAADVAEWTRKLRAA
jgi:hypothetical protein